MVQYPSANSPFRYTPLVHHHLSAAMPTISALKLKFFMVALLSVIMGARGRLSVTAAEVENHDSDTLTQPYLVETVVK
jgi:hypothetical protein